MHSTRDNIGAYIASVAAGVTAATPVTAASTGDNTLVTGTAVDLGITNRPLSMSVVFPVTTTLINTHTLSLSAYLQSTADSTNGPWVNVATQALTVAATGVTGNGAQTVTLDVDFGLVGAKRYVRVLFTPLCSGTGTDTANIFPPVMILAGQSELPV